MKPAAEPWWGLSGGRRRAALSVILAVQVLAGVFFLGDVVADAIADGGSTHLYLEALVAVALCGGLAVSAAALKAAHEQLRSQEQAVAVAAGALHDLVAAQFEAWGLTAAERDVGMLALKGLDVGDIAALRGAAAGDGAGAAVAGLHEGGGHGAGAVRGAVRGGPARGAAGAGVSVSSG